MSRQGPGVKSGESQDGAQEREQQESLARIEAGHIPASAVERLGALRDGGGAFTSELSVGGFALCRQLGLTPVSQVMGSSIYQMGYQAAWGQPGAWGSLGLGGSFMVELNTLSEALNDVRGRALYRLSEEAHLVGADAVVGVSTKAGESGIETGSVALEHTVIGTAVRRANAPGKTGQPVLTELSLPEFALLVQAGFEPLGIVAWSSVFFGGFAFGRGLGGGEMLAFGPGAVQNFELREFTQAFYAARETVMAQLGAQAAALGADGIVGMRIGHSARRQSLATGMGSRERAGLMITFNAVGTAIAQRERERGQPRLPAVQPVIDLLA